MTKEEFVAKIVGVKKVSAVVLRYIDKCYEEAKRLCEEERNLLCCCANCVYAMQGDCDEFENCGSCDWGYNICQNKTSPHNKERTDWSFSCSCWALYEEKEVSND